MKKFEVQYKYNTATENAIFTHLKTCNHNFIPRLDSYTNIKEYAKKIYEKSVLIEAWQDKTLIGCIAVYFSDLEDKVAYITNVSIIKEFTRAGIATSLLKLCINYAKSKNFQIILLEVYKNNVAAIRLYEKFQFRNIKNKKKNTLILSYKIT